MTGVIIEALARDPLGRHPGINSRDPSFFLMYPGNTCRDDRREIATVFVPRVIEATMLKLVQVAVRPLPVSMLPFAS